MKRTSRVVLGITAAMLAVSAVPATATPGSGESARTQHVERFKLRTHTNHAFDPRNYVGTDVVRSPTGRFRGYDSYSGYVKGTKNIWRFALALKGGIIFGRVAATPTGTGTTGRILGGSGKFAGIEGTAEIRFTTPQTLILRYRL